ncbi:CbtA family protein [Kaistia dalseonensis]|uniref:Cobalt transporter subunit CbtA n=1 Tax=Kaistia dalseonensis TaxID=410840 RepID=A0ABU0H339_9HYPH|nr:CbtA family protein [Kaistia dalseonensis]MCX5493754.1 CbtA family protein [Kaistia dalseonensis]MDQ0436318.1 cobalt transporter subunit CbtA [Kaistia dalseonensis]
MLKTIIVSAFGAGLLVGAILTGVQLVTTEPLILHGETFEKAAEAAPAVAASVPHDHGADSVSHGPAAAPEAHHHDEGAWEPTDGFERSAYTLLANLLMGVAVSAILLGVMTLKGGRIDARTGVLWGLGGFFAASLLPSLGLSPELPGTAAAEITSRQIWWLSTAAASAVGLALIVFGSAWFWKAAGVVIAIVPHVIGAPQPPTLEAAYPAALGAEFVAASLVVSALLWSLSGVFSGWLYQRLSRSD